MCSTNIRNFNNVMNQSILNLDKLVILLNKRNDLIFSSILEFDFPNIKFIESNNIKNKSEASKQLFQSYYHIYYRGQKIGYFLDNQSIYSDLIQIGFEKIFVYNNQNIIIDFYNDLISTDLLEFNNFNKLEICLNSLDKTIWNDIFEIYTNYADSAQCIEPIYKSSFKGKLNINSSNNNSFYIQSNNKGKSSNVIAIYRKTDLEDFQIQYYNENNLTVFNHLYRLEIRLSVEYFRTIRKDKGISFDFLEIFDLEIQKQIFDLAIGKKLTFKDTRKFTYSNSRNKVYEVKVLYKPSKTLKSIPKPKPIKYTSNPLQLNQRAKNKLFRDSVIDYLIYPTLTKFDFIIEKSVDVNISIEFKKLEEKNIDKSKLQTIRNQIHKIKNLNLKLVA